MKALCQVPTLMHLFLLQLPQVLQLLKPNVLIANQLNPVTCDLSCWPLVLLDKTWTAMRCAALSGAAVKVLKLAC